MTIPVSKCVKADPVLDNSQARAATPIESEAIPTETRVSMLLHNNDRPVDRIPVEVLCDIFLYHAETYWKLEDDCRPFTHTLLSITHVCHRWREAAINFSFLWTHISFVNDEWAALMVERSKNLPIVAFGNIPIDHSTALNFDVPPSRVERLEVGCSLKEGSTEGQVAIINLPHKAAPKLKVMHAWARAGSTGAIVGKVFDGMMPMLEYLRLERLSFDWTWVKLATSLTQLVVQNTPRPPTLLKLHSALRELLNLEILVLEGALPHPENERMLDQSSDLAISLPRLRLLWIRDVIPSVNNIYQYFNLLPETAVNVCTRFNVGDDVPLATLLTLLLGRLLADGRPLHAHLETLLVDHWSPDQLTIRAGLHTVDVSEPDETLAIPFGDASRFPTSLHLECKDFAVLHAALPVMMHSTVMNLETTGLTYQTALVRTLYPELLPGLHFLNHASRTLKKLVLVDGAAGVFAPSFGPLHRMRQYSYHEALICGVNTWMHLSALEDIHVHWFDFKNGLGPEAAKKLVKGMECRRRWAASNKKEYRFGIRMTRCEVRMRQLKKFIATAYMVENYP